MHRSISDTRAAHERHLLYDGLVGAVNRRQRTTLAGDEAARQKTYCTKDSTANTTDYEENIWAMCCAANSQVTKANILEEHADEQVHAYAPD
jgi:hypothetical protein